MGSRIGRPSTALSRRRAVDRAARWVITGGGIAVIVCIAAILVFISLEAWPLLRGARGELSNRMDVTDMLRSAGAEPSFLSPVVAVGIEDYQEVA